MRFADTPDIESIPPINVSDEGTGTTRRLDGATEAELRELATSMHGTRLNQHRAGAFNFEPVSLPASRVS